MYILTTLLPQNKLDAANTKHRTHLDVGWRKRTKCTYELTLTTFKHFALNKNSYAHQSTNMAASFDSKCVSDQLRQKSCNYKLNLYYYCFHKNLINFVGQ